MVRVIDCKWMGSSVDKYYYEFAGLSTDAKPVDNVVTGSLFMEADTGKVYVFDETGAGTWTEIGG